MNPALLFKLRPTTPWRSGPDSGARNRVDSVYHSDSLYAAVTAAMARLGHLDEWLAATAAGADGAAVRFSSCFPFLEQTSFIIPPRTMWPPAALAARVRWKSARFVPVDVVSALFAGAPPQEERWGVDGVSECLVPAGVPGPFRTAMRWSAAVDRLSGASDRHATACLEFRPGAGLWAVASFPDEEQRERWSGRVKAALRLLADSGFGGERSRGWGRSEQPEFVDGVLPDLILPARSVPVEPEPEEASPESAALEAVQAAEAPSPVSPSPSPTAHWLLSLFTPSEADAVDWDKGNYAMVSRGGRIESPAAYGDLKKQLNMVCEGSVLVARELLRGAAPDVAPDGFPHPVYRAGFAVSIPIPRQVNP
jgi:CRISPR type III-A-associated RAMP protein Csm4